jgi:magnesium-transporting ATPase (P-type)
MTENYLKHKPVFTKLQKALQKLSDYLFCFWMVASILPFLAWSWIADKLPTGWNDLGKPIQWGTKPMIMVGTILSLLVMTLFQYLIRMSAANPALFSEIQNGALGKITPQNVDSKYNLVRNLNIFLLLILNTSNLLSACFLAHAYLSGGNTMYRPFMSVIPVGIGVFSFIVYLIRAAML